MEEFGSRYFRFRRARVLAWLVVVLVSFCLPVEAQIKKYPADVIPQLSQPYSIFLNDYSTPGSKNLSANIIFNDFHEPSWNFKLRIKIESAQVRLETVQGYTPQAPITLAPGIIRTFSGADWENYFNYNNLVVSGLSVNDMVASGGKLPEGFYSFCFQVLDYETGDPLSEEICRTAFLKLTEPPRLNLPTCGRNLDPKLTQHPFTWQLLDALSPTGQTTNFQLTVWEVTDPAAAVQTAVANGQALQIFQSPILNQATYSYGLADPPLEIGKRYVYRVQAIDPDGRDRFKNQGNSEFCTFFYGWPTNGKIDLQFPIEGGGFRKKDIPNIKWSPVNTQLPGQPVTYELKIVPMSDGQTKEQSIESNTPWYYFNTPPNPAIQERSQQIDKKLEVMTKYAWQVKAFTDQQEVGKSGVAYFNGPSLMENFWASVHRVAVDYLDGTNLNDISGEGRIRLKPDADAWTPIRFEHIQLQDMGDFYVMVGGEFSYTPPQKLSIELSADVERNGKAYFDVDRFRVNKDGIYAEGLVRWPFPIPAISNGVATVRSQKQMANYNNFTINSVFYLDEGNDFRLLEPFNFSVSLKKSSMVYVNNDTYRFDFNGSVELPAVVKSRMPGRVSLPFSNAEQLFYIQQDSTGTAHGIAPLPRSNVEIFATKYTLDLSEEESPDKFQGDLLWKGIYFDNFDLVLNKTLDGNGQFDVVDRVVTSIVQPATRELDAFVSSSGLNLTVDINYPDSTQMMFQTFPAMVNRLNLTSVESQIVAEKSIVKGGFLIPVISNERKFLFTIPVNNLGFQDGYLEDLENTKFIHNRGSGDQEIHLSVKRAVLQGYEKISMTVDLEWPSIGVTLEGLRGFNAWGDYSIGFDSKNGTIPLSQRYNAKLSGYPITIGVIGAGSNEGSYVFATTSDAVLGDDVGGGAGVPSINVYSVYANPLVPKDAAGQIVISKTTQVPKEQATGEVQKSYSDLENSLKQKVEVDQEKLVSSAEALQKSMGNESTIYAPEDLITSPEEQFPAEVGQGAETVGNPQFNSRQQEIIYEIASGFVEELARPILDPVKAKTDSLNKAIADRINGIIDSTGVVVGTNVGVLVTALATDLADALKNDKVDLRPAIMRMADQTTLRITEEIISSLRQSSQENILDPINVLLTEQINGRINKHITVNGTRIVFESITGNSGNAEDALHDLIAGSPTVLKAILKDVSGFISIKNIRSTLEGTASDFVKNINMSEVGHDLRKTGEDILKEELNKLVGAAVTKLAEQYAQDLGLGGFGLAAENPIDFVGVAQRFKEGGIKGVFAIDPVRVRLKTPVIDLDGFMSYTPQHPVYGDVWLGDIDMTIKVPKKFSFNAIYFNGRKDDVSYWFCQLTPPGDENTPYQLGKPLAKAAKPLKDPVNIGIAQIVGASGRLYHHMKESPGNGIVPDASMRYGAYMHFVFFDKQTDGENLRLEVSGEINSSENGDYTIAFDGNLQTRSKAPKVLEIDTQAAVQGTVMVRYNSAEEHFLGYAKVVVKTESLCASASLLVDVKPGKWRVAIGTREDRIVFVPGCAGWSPTGWLDVNQNEAEIGLGIMYSGKAKSPDINIGIVEFNIEVDAGFAFGILAVIQYKPSFQLMRAGVWVDIWANIIANYKFPFRSWKKIVLVEIFIRGDLVIIFNPPPTMLEGKLNGKVKVLCFNMNFKAQMKKKI